MKKVAIIDSGSGGINVLAKCVEKCPCFNYLLYIDDKNVPYGNKSKEDLLRIAKNIILDLNSFFHPDIVVIGCNTLTAVAIDFLKVEFSKIKFIGTYPNIEEAKKLDKYIVLATKVTIENSPLLCEIQSKCFYPPDLPKVIDENLFSREKIKKYLQNTLPKEDYKAVVLGCTHFEGIKLELAEIYPSAKFFDASDGVTKELSRYAYDSSCQVQIISSREKFAEFYNYFSSIKFPSSSL